MPRLSTKDRREELAGQEALAAEGVRGRQHQGMDYIVEGRAAMVVLVGIA